MVMEGVEPSTVALLAQRSNQLSYTTLTDYLFFILYMISTFLYILTLLILDLSI